MDSLEDDLAYNGVVYNEMKGAFSSPEGVLDRVVLNTLFPDTSYANESGGDPEVIPELTYEQFLDFHRRYYHPSNSYIYLYGNMDMEEKLNWLDQEYLSKFDYAPVDSKIRYQEPFDKVIEKEMPYSIASDESEEDNTYISYNKVIAVVLRIGVGLLALWLVATGLNHIGLDGLSNGKLVCLVKMCINGCISMLVYVAVTVALKIPQLVFHKSLSIPRGKK